MPRRKRLRPLTPEEAEAAREQVLRELRGEPEPVLEDDRWWVTGVPEPSAPDLPADGTPARKRGTGSRHGGTSKTARMHASARREYSRLTKGGT
jgi:hypothetical protein